MMKIIIRHNWLLGLVAIFSLSGCGPNPTPPTSVIVPQDTLVEMVHRKIENKKRQKKQMDNFRRRYLPSNFSIKIKKYFPIIRKYSKRYGFDWRLIIALILKESYFKENARSHVGAMGLMQIMPRTAREITRELDIAYISKDPLENITAGIYHLFKQLQYFKDADPENRLKLAMAAYNCGPARIFDAQKIAKFKQLDPNTWEAVKICLPLLENDQKSVTLHLEVWEKGVPSHGYFFGSDETVDYVDDITKKYKILMQMYKFKVQYLPIEESVSR